MLAVKLKGERFDAGDWVDYLTANLYFALKEEQLQPKLLARVRKMLVDYPSGRGE